ncbi:NAD-dependent epimerase/dehydratase family protein [Halobaculum limi]|uniref:NAD-dependent epimerase/dehydratase family protein n=1 Tax=Halobaculum limi TaxID=3031916 RepID=UPI0024060F73|nr:NAD-dependent epimerase/dehydratase family protein [Halobaculum sp. YSMS11]
MGDTALVIGGTRFIGRHTVEDLLDHDYEVAIFNRGNHENPFADHDDVTHVEGDRRERMDLKTAKLSVDPDIVIDCVAYYPEDVRVATDLFDDVDGYVYISSGSSYADEEIPKREGETALCDCTPEQEEDDSMETYGPRKAEGDRAIFAAAEDGANAMAVRPCIVYGPYDYTERLDYWVDRVLNHDRVVVPGDGQNIWHRAYVEDVASALRVVAEEGEAGEAYNVGDRRLVTMEEMVNLIADAADTTCEVVHASDHELSAGGLTSSDFILYRDYPHVLDTNKLAALGWESTPLSEAMERTVAEHHESDRDGSEHDPGREAEERVLGVLETV